MNLHSMLLFASYISQCSTYSYTILLLQRLFRQGLPHPNGRGTLENFSARFARNLFRTPLGNFLDPPLQGPSQDFRFGGSKRDSIITRAKRAAKILIQEATPIELIIISYVRTRTVCN